MPLPLSRRRFLSSSAGLCALAALPSPLRAVDPPQRSGKCRLQLSLAAYSFRDSFKSGRDRDGKPFDLFSFIDYCADHGCDGAELTSYYFPKSLDDAFLIKLRRHAFLRGVAISGSAVGNNFAQVKGPKLNQEISDVKKWIDHAALIGAPHIRVFAGAPRGLDESEARNNCIAALEECCDYAGTKAIFLGLENHGGIVAEPSGLLQIVKAVKSPWLGINLDTGNFRTDNPYADLATCAPYAVNVQYKLEVHPKNSEVQPSDLKRVVTILKDAHYEGYVALEYESKPDPWSAIPGALAQMKKEFRAASVA